MGFTPAFCWPLLPPAVCWPSGPCRFVGGEGPCGLLVTSSNWIPPKQASLTDKQAHCSPRSAQSFKPSNREQWNSELDTPTLYPCIASGKLILSFYSRYIRMQHHYATFKIITLLVPPGASTCKKKNRSLIQSMFWSKACGTRTCPTQWDNCTRTRDHNPIFQQKNNHKQHSHKHLFIFSMSSLSKNGNHG